MAWSLSGSTITQSGTDTDLSGLAGIALPSGFDFIESGNHRDLIAASSGSRIVVSGNLTLPLATDYISFHNIASAQPVRINSGGRLQLVGDDSRGYSIKSSRIAAGSTGHATASVSVIDCESGGTLEIIGGGIVARQPINVRGEIIARDAIVQSGFAANGILCMFRYTGSPIVDIIGLTLKDMSYVQDAVPSEIRNLEGLKVSISAGGTNNVATIFRSGFDLVDPSFEGNVNTHLSMSLRLTSQTAQRVRVYGWDRNLPPLIGKVPDFATANNWFEGRKIILLTVQNTLGELQSGVVSIFRDVDNGSRYSGEYGSANYTNDEVYEGETDANGLVVFDTLLWEVSGRLTGSVGVNANMVVDYRWQPNHVYNIPIPLKSYENLPSTVVVDASGFGKELDVTASVIPDSAVTKTKAQAEALTVIETIDDLYDALKVWSYQPDNFNYPANNTQIATANGQDLNLGGRNLVVDLQAAAMLAVDTVTDTITINSSIVSGRLTSITTTGTVTLLNGATVDGAVEDANGVRVTIRRADGLAFNMVARHGTEGDYVDLGFHENTTTQTFTVPKGRPVEFALKTKGWATVRRTLQTANGGVVFEAEPIFNEAVDTSLDVTGFMQNISLSNGGGVFNFVFEADMDVPGIEVAKTLIDDLVSQELALRSTLPPGTGTIIDILGDEIRINQPVVQLILGAGANNVTQRGFINIAPALAVNPNYVINPRRPADNLRVDLPLNKPTLDPTVLALAVRADMERDGGGLQIINNGVKKASLLIPHAEDL